MRTPTPATPGWGCRGIYTTSGDASSKAESYVKRFFALQDPGFGALQDFWFDRNSGEDLRVWRRAEAIISQPVNTCILLDEIYDFMPDCCYLFDLRGIGGIGLISALNALSYPWAFHLMDCYHLKAYGFGRQVLSVYDAFKGRFYKKGKIIAMSNTLVSEIETSEDFTFHEHPSIIPGWAFSPSDAHHDAYMKNGHVKLVTAGRISQEKGIGLIIEAAAMLKSANVHNYSIDIYGRGDIPTFQQMAVKLGVADKIQFKGWRSQDQLKCIYLESDLFLFPTWIREPFGLAPLEASAVGCVPVITAGCGVAECMSDLANCLKIDQDSQSLSNIMIAVCAGSIDLHTLGKNAQLLVENQLNLETIIDQIENLLEHLLTDEVSPRKPTSMDYSLDMHKYNLSREILFKEVFNRNSKNLEVERSSSERILPLYSSRRSRLKSTVKSLLIPLSQHPLTTISRAFISKMLFRAN